MPAKPPRSAPAAAVPASNIAELPARAAKPRAAARSGPVVEVPVVTAKAPMKKKEFMDRAAARSGIRKSDAKAAIEATLVTLAEALAQGQEIVLPPLGKLKVTKEKPGKSGRQFTVRLVLPKAGETPTEGLAEGAD